MRRWVLALSAAAVLTQAAAGQFGDPFGTGEPDLPPRFRAAVEHASMTAAASHEQVRPGETFHLAVSVDLDEGWVLYSPTPGGEGIFEPKPSRLTVDAGALDVGRVLWPPDEPYETDLGDVRAVNRVYKGRPVIYVEMSVPEDAEAGEAIVGATLTGQICEKVCLDLMLDAVATVRIGDESIASEQWTDELAAGLADARPAGEIPDADGERFAAAPQYTAWAGIALALLAGLILNVMPCVLPVIPIRIMSIVNMANESRRRYVTMGLAFAGGILLFFVGLAVVNAVLAVAAQQAFDWGRHFQSRPLRVALALLVVALAANMLGAFNVLVPGRIAGLGQGADRRESHASSAGMGLMMAILATPCSFAILLGALAWAQTQPLWLGTLAMLAIGVGMAAPHALLAAFPSLVNRLPRPGRWMELLKQSMGFGLLLVAVWLIGTLSPSSYPFWVAAYAVILAFALWMWGSWVRYDAPARRKLIVRGLAVVLAVAAGWWMLRPPQPPAVDFEDYQPGRIELARREGRVVLVDFTAAWCLSCQWIERTIYDSEEVADALGSADVLALRADVTEEDSPASELLYERLGGAPPLTVVYPPDAAAGPIRLVGKFSKQDLYDALDEAATDRPETSAAEAGSAPAPAEPVGADRAPL